MRAKKNLEGYLYIMPGLLGIILFTLYPMIQGFVFSFLDVDLLHLSQSHFVGLANYREIFNGSNLSKTVMLALRNTVVYTAIEVPLSMISSYFLALLISGNNKTNRVFRIIYYIPVVMPAVVNGLVWRNILDNSYGLVNSVLKTVFGTSFDFMEASHSMGTFVVMSLFSIGGGMIIWLSAFKSIPTTYYEAARVDGASAWARFRHITLPLSTPYIFYNLVMGIIGTLKIFEGPYVLTGGTGGDGDSLLFYVMEIYRVGFEELNFGQAAAISWILFVIILCLTALVFKTSKWVFYGGDE